MAAYGSNQCLPADHPKILGVRPGQLGTPGTPGAPVAPQPVKPLTLQDILMQAFEKRSGAFGYQDGRTPISAEGQFAGTLGVDQFGNPLSAAPNLSGRSLIGGGILWGPEGQDLAQYGSGIPAAPAAPVAPPPAPTPAPAAAQQTLSTAFTTPSPEFFNKELVTGAPLGANTLQSTLPEPGSLQDMLLGNEARKMKKAPGPTTMRNDQYAA
jgi:hypothetical protein